MPEVAGWNRYYSTLEPGDAPTYFAPGELAQFQTLRREVFAKHLTAVPAVAEFGCGLGHNLVALQAMGKRVEGFDWASEAVRRVRERGIPAQVFDMLDPPVMPFVGAALTVHAMEQLGFGWRPFLAYLIENTPPLVIHIEPIEELYDDTERDQERLRYHRSRGYLSGYLTRLRDMEAAGEAELIEVRKSPFGGRDHDAYSVIVWRPL